MVESKVITVKALTIAHLHSTSGVNSQIIGSLTVVWLTADCSMYYFICINCSKSQQAKEEIIHFSIIHVISFKCF